MSRPSVSEIDTIIDANINAFAIETFLAGIYTVVFAHAIWRLYTQKKHVVYTAAVTLLWICVLVVFAIDWKFHRNAFIISNSTALDIVTYLLGGIPLPHDQSLIQDIASMISVLIADGLQIWRCTILWGGNRLVWAALSVLFLAALGANICWVISGQILLGGTTGPTAIATALSVSAALSVCAATLIALRIWLTTRRSPTRRTYTQIIEIVTESAVLYAIGSLFVAIGNATAVAHGGVHLSTKQGLAHFCLVTYTAAIQTVMTGLAPTLLVLRIAQTKPEQLTSSRSSPMSSLAFRRTVQDRHSGSGLTTTHVSTGAHGNHGIRDIRRSFNDAQPHEHVEGANASIESVAHIPESKPELI